MPYAVQTPVYEGPFDLLLHLIVRQEVDLYEISLATVVDGYLAELERLRDLDLDVATEFLLIAATLIELKTKRLLPGRDEVDLDEELALWEERDLLLTRLLECKTFKDVAGVLARRMDEASRSTPRTVGPDERFADLAPDLLAGLTPSDLRAAYVRATTPRPTPRVDVSHLGQIRVTVNDAVAELLDELPRSGHLTFRRLTADLGDRIEVVVRFLAVLELYKEGLVDLHQTTTFGEIVITWLGDGESDERVRSVATTVGSYDG